MNFLFKYCHSLEQLNLSNFNINNALDMYHMFYDCGFTHIVFPEWFDTSEVVRMDNMFYSAKKPEGNQVKN